MISKCLAARFDEADEIGRKRCFGRYVVRVEVFEQTAEQGELR